jgi:hypothetical protein
VVMPATGNGLSDENAWTLQWVIERLTPFYAAAQTANPPFSLVSLKLRTHRAFPRELQPCRYAGEHGSDRTEEDHLDEIIEPRCKHGPTRCHEELALFADRCEAESLAGGSITACERAEGAILLVGRCDVETVG